MASNADIFDDLLVRLRLRVGEAVLHVVTKDDDHVAIQVGENLEAVVGVRIKDPARPQFHMSYPVLTVKKDGSRHVAITDFEGAVYGGVEWVVCQLAEHGVVMPEFVD